MSAAKAISASPANKINGRGCLFAFGSIFFLVGASLFFVSTIKPWFNSLRTRSWAESQSTITRSRVDVRRGDDSDTYRPDIEFQYQFNNQQWSSSTWGTGYTGNASRARAQTIVDRYPVGSNHACYVNPKDASQAVLDRSFQVINLWSGLFASIFALFGGVVIYLSQRTKNSSNIRPIASRAFSGDASKIVPVADSEEGTLWAALAGPQKLKPSERRVQSFLAVLAIAAFWNTISWILFYQSWKANQWFGTLFSVPFVAIGAILIGAAIYKFMQIFNPVVSVAITNGAASPGESIDIAWETTGMISRISELQLTIVGQEVVTYVRGTTTSTDKRIFQRIPLASVTTESDIRFGSVTTTIPSDAIHTFLAPNNKIQWSIEVHGKIAWWPDVRESMAFAVRPATNDFEPLDNEDEQPA